MIKDVIQQLKEMRLYGFLYDLEQQLSNSSYSQMPFEDRLASLVSTEYLRRKNNKLKKTLKSAKLRHNACMENIDLCSTRGLEKKLVLSLSNCLWVENRNNIIITGATGTGKTYLSCALVDRACKLGFKGMYLKTQHLTNQLLLAKAEGVYTKELTKLAKLDVLILDDWLREPIDSRQGRDILDLIDDRYGNTSTILVSQLPVENWHCHINEPTIADALLDRIIHNSQRVILTGDSMRKKLAQPS